MDRITAEHTLQMAVNRFNEEMDTHYSMVNVKHECFNLENAAEVYERFCSRYFPNRLNDDYRSLDYFSDSIAMAFTGPEYDGILYNEPICTGFKSIELYEIFLHELSHIFCVHNEIRGGDFYGRYCCNNSGDVYTDGMMNAGYAVWREFIAGVMTDCVFEYSMGGNLSDFRPEIMWHWERIAPENPNAKRHLSELLVLLITSREIALAQTWDEVRRYVQELNVTDVKVFYNLVKAVWENLYVGDYWEIDEEFIHSLGSIYLALLSIKHMESL